MENVVYEPLKSLRVGDPPTGSSPGAGGRSRRRTLGTAFAVGLGVAALGGSPASALAADDCPNAAVRAQQQAQHLPNCMAYERVTPADKSGGVPIVRAIADDGGGALFGMPAMLGETLSFSDPQYRSVRGAEDGAWATGAQLPALNGPVRRPLLADYFTTEASSPDLSRTLFSTPFPLAANDQNSGSGVNRRLMGPDLYLREPDGSFRWLVADPSAIDVGVNEILEFKGASLDLERVVLWTQRRWDSRTPAGVGQLYMWTSDGVRAVSELPDGTLPASGAYSSDADPSADGRRIAFSVGSGASERVYVRFSADDPATASTREVGVGPNGEICQTPTTGPSPLRQFQRLSDDGSKVIFRCANALLPGAPEDANYVRDLDGGPAAVRLLGTGIVQAANADFSRIYVEGLPDSPGGKGSISVIRDGVATLVGTVAEFGLFGKTFLHPAVSADGEYFAFQSQDKFDLPGVDQGSSGDLAASPPVAATPQVFLVSARTGELRCVSCQPAGTATSGAAQLDTEIRSAADDFSVSNVTAVVFGRVTSRGSVVFNSTTGLVPEDVNGVSDAYAWIDGRPVLLSGGRNREPSAAAGVSLDGRSFFVTAPDALVRDDVDGGQYDLYAVREDGGRLVSDPAPECETNCQGPGAERPGLPGLGSTDAHGRGNLVEETTQAKQSARASASLTVPSAVRGTRTTVRVKVSRAGSIRVSGAGVRQATVKVKKAGTYRVTVRLSAHGASQQRSRGRLATKLTARFTPESGASVSARKSIRFTAAKRGGR